MLRWLVCALVVAVLVGTVEAGCPTTVTTTGFYTTPVVGTTYAATNYSYVPYNTAVAAYVPLAVAVPTYSTGYLPQNPPAATTATQAAAKEVKKDRSEELLKEMLTEVRRLNGRMDAVEQRVNNFVPVTGFVPHDQRPAYPPQTQPGYAPQGNGGYQPTAKQVKGGSPVLNAACAQCHERGNEINGGGFVLTERDGRLARLTERQVEKTLKHLAKGTMPPPDNEMGIPALSEQDKAQVAAAVQGR